MLDPSVGVMHRRIDRVAPLVRDDPDRVDLIGGVEEKPRADMVILGDEPASPPPLASLPSSSSARLSVRD